MRQTKVKALRRMFRTLIHERNANTGNKRDVITPKKAVSAWKRFKRSYVQGKFSIPRKFHDKEFYQAHNKGA